MNFIYYGHFYRLTSVDHDCRSTLEIVRSCDTLAASAAQDPSVLLRLHPDAVFVLLNPGSSKPCEGQESSQVTSLGQLDGDARSNLVQAFPDPTIQNAIEPVMSCKSFNHVRVINLFDLRQQKSALLTEWIKRDFEVCGGKQIPDSAEFRPYSIFSCERRRELRHRLKSKDGEIVVVGWGAESALGPFYSKAHKVLEGEGMQIHGWTTGRFFHPSRREDRWASYIFENWPTPG